MTNREPRDRAALDRITGSQASRRSVAKGLVWTVPVISVATAAPAFAVSPPPPPPPPDFQFDLGYKNPGNKCTSTCIPFQSYGVPVLVSNNTGEDYIIQFTSYIIKGNAVGVFGLTASIGCAPLNTGCDLGSCVTTPPLAAANSLCVPDGTTNLTIYVTSNENGASNQGSQRIDYRWIRKSDCSIPTTSFASSPTSPPNDAC